MNLSDLLSELRISMLNDRSDRISGTSDYLWTDETLIRYINESQRRFARKGLVIRDGSTAEVVNVTLETGVDEYVLHPAVLAVMSAKLEDDVRDLARAGHSALNFIPAASDNWDLSITSTISPGKPVAFSTDERVDEDDDGTQSVVTLRVFPKPSSDFNNTLLKLRVVRLPLDDLTPSNMSAVPEVPPDHHLEMLCWAAHLALRIADDDAGNQPLSDKYAMMFEGYVKDARTMVMRKLFAPQPWGFGRNGWAWGS